MSDPGGSADKDCDKVTARKGGTVRREADAVKPWLLRLLLAEHPVTQDHRGGFLPFTCTPFSVTDLALDTSTFDSVISTFHPFPIMTLEGTSPPPNIQS